MNLDLSDSFFAVEGELELSTKLLGGNTRDTARKAAQILEKSNQGFIVPTIQQRQWLLVAFARKGLTLYGKAFDIIKVNSELDFSSEENVEKNVNSISICEIKSTNKVTVKDDFTGFFFSLSTAELLTAQNLKSRYKFVLVNTLSKKFIELSLKDIFFSLERYLSFVECPVLVLNKH